MVLAHELEFAPNAVKLDLGYLSSPCGSVPSEREFKTASEISKGDRIRLLPTKKEKLLFLKYNLRAIGFASSKLPRPPTELVLPNQNVEAKESDGFILHGLIYVFRTQMSQFRYLWLRKKYQFLPGTGVRARVDP